MISTASVFLSVTSNGFEISSFFRNSIAVSIMMSQDDHNVHNVTPRLLIMVEKAQFIDIVRLLCNLGIMWDVHYHSHLREYIYAFHTIRLCDCFYECFASHITRPPSKYDVRLNNTA